MLPVPQMPAVPGTGKELFYLHPMTARFIVSLNPVARPPLSQPLTSRGLKLITFGRSFFPTETTSCFLHLAAAHKPGQEIAAIYAASLDSKERKLILNSGTNAVYVLPGYLLFTRQGALMAQPFDAARLQLEGEAVPVAQGIQVGSLVGRGAFSASDNGVLAYRSGAIAPPLTLVWVSRNGTERRLGAPAHNYVLPRLSPDAQRLAVGIEEAENQIWLYDLSRDALTRLTFEGVTNVDPIWTPDGKRIVFKGNKNRIFWQPADGSGTAEDLISGELSTNNVPGSWSPDGKELALIEDRAVRKIWIMPVKDRSPHVFVR